MGQERQLALHTFAFLALPFFLSSCKLEETLLPTESTAGTDAITTDAIIGANNASAETTSSSITAPIISDPLSGTTISDREPVLTVLNSAHEQNTSLTYLFQVSSDSSFTTLDAQSAQVPEGADGSTSWQVDRVLPDGRHFWRVRSRAGTVDSSFSSTAEFTIGAGADPSPTNPDTPPPPSAGTIVSDPLNGGSIGEVYGGQFTGSGWRVSSPANFIRYEVPPMASGWVEFDITGLREVNPSHDQFMLFGMWDPTAGDYRANRFRVHLQKLHPDPHNPPYLRLRWIANGEQHDEGSNFLDWNPSQTYRFRLEWGPSGSGHTARVFLDGQLQITANYSRVYRPNVLFIELGIGERGESIVGATYSNVQIGN